MKYGGFSTHTYIAIVVFVIAVNVWLTVRFLIKASKWEDKKRDDPDRK